MPLPCTRVTYRWDSCFGDPGFMGKAMEHAEWLAGTLVSH